MGLDVYTPAYNRLEENSEWIAAQARYRQWENRPTVLEQNETEADWKEFREFRAIIGRLESQAGHFGYRTPFHSLVGPIAAFDKSGDYHLSLTAEQVGEFLKEWRFYLAGQVKQGKHLEQWVNGLDEPVQSPFQQAVRRFKNWCQVYRLGEGCYVA
ncbi:MAG TPA: hypothetical protein VE866_01765 [Candidatus Binatia bacterium]|jgi:hypothetical protein|nr:hypothetical protein [Candidatus Binatia bacterium]